MERYRSGLVWEPQDPTGESHDGAYGNDDVYYTAEQWDHFEEPFGQDDDDVFDDDDEEVNALNVSQ